MRYTLMLLMTMLAGFPVLSAQEGATAQPDMASNLGARVANHKAQVMQKLIDGLRSEKQEIRGEAAAVLHRYGPMAKPALPALIESMKLLDESAPIGQIVDCLEICRTFGKDANAASPLILDFMRERSPILRNRPKMALQRLRACMLLTLTDLGSASDALQYSVEFLANSDATMLMNYAAAARAVGTGGAQAKDWVPFLARALKAEFVDQELTLLSFRAPITAANRTSGRLEAIRALAQIGPAAAEAIPLLEQLCRTETGAKDNLPPWKAEAQKALSMIKTGTSTR